MSASNINAPGLLGKRVAVLDSDGRRLAEEMEQRFAQQGRVEVVLSGFDFISDTFLHGSWGRFLRRAPTLEEAERRYQNTIFLYVGPAQCLRARIHHIGHLVLIDAERRDFSATP